jgi:hypothetical protein
MKKYPVKYHPGKNHLEAEGSGVKFSTLTKIKISKELFSGEELPVKNLSGEEHTPSEELIHSMRNVTSISP